MARPPCAAVRVRVIAAFKSTSGKYDDLSLPSAASAARAVNHAARVSGLFLSAVSMASSSVIVDGGVTTSAAGSGRGIAFAGGVHGTFGAVETSCAHNIRNAAFTS